MRFATASMILAYVAAVSVHGLSISDGNAVEQRSAELAGLERDIEQGAELSLRQAKLVVYSYLKTGF
jgi:hypothetical protein